MPPIVLTFSTQLGSGGPAIARSVSEALRYPYFDREVITSAAANVGVSPETVADSERWPSLVERWLESLSQVATVGDGMLVPAYDYPGLRMTSADYRQMIEQVVRELAKRGRCVIVGHAGQATLSDQGENVFKVLVWGSAEKRTARLASQSGKDPTEVRCEVEESDRTRFDLFEHVYKIAWLDSQLYDLVINTDAIGLEAAKSCILAAVG